MLFGSYLYGQASPSAQSDKSTLVTGAFPVRSDRSNEVHGFGLRGDSVRNGNELLSCRGNCELTLGSVVLNADEVDFHSETGVAEARGNVRIKALPLYGVYVPKITPK